MGLGVSVVEVYSGFPFSPPFYRVERKVCINESWLLDNTTLLILQIHYKYGSMWRMLSSIECPRVVEEL